MEVVLITLGVLGLGAIVVSAYVFMVAARNYVSYEATPYRGAPTAGMREGWVARSPGDRRSGRPVTFPLMVNGILIDRDRRILPDRRSPLPA